MARDIDSVIDFIKDWWRLGPIQKQVMINRLHPPPTEEELKIARKQMEANDFEPFNPEYKPQ